MATSSQKFIGRNRAPRVQIEYDVELYGAEKKIQLPFVMGVLADLSGKPQREIAGASGKIQGLLTRPEPSQRQRESLPQPMCTPRHQIIH